MATRQEQLEAERREVERLRGEYDALTESQQRATEGQALQDDIRETTARIRELESATDDATNSMEALGTVGASSLSGIIEGLSKTGSEAKEGIDAYYSNLTALFGDKKNLYVELLNSLGADYAQSMDRFSQDSETLAYQVGGTIDEMYGRFMTTDLPMYFGSLEEFAAFGEEIYYSVGSGYAAMSQMGEDAAATIESSALMAKGLGFTATEMMDAMDAQFSKSGEFSNDIMREITTYSNTIAEVTGDSNKVIARGILDITTNFETFANVSVETAAETIGGLRSIGLEVKDLQAVTNKFLNFDQGAESLANLNTVFGMQLDTMSMMEAASQDPFDAMMMLRDAFIETGGDFEDLTQQQKNLLAAQAGLDVEAAARLFDPDRAVADMADLTAATEAQAEEGVLSTTESIDSLAESISKIPGLQRSFTDTVFNRMAMRDLSALSNSSLVAEASMTRFAATAGTQVPEALRNLLPDETGDQLVATIEEAQEAVIGGTASVIDATGAMFGDAGRSIPDNILQGLDDADDTTWDEINSRIAGNVSPISPTVGGTGGAERTANDVLITDAGDRITLNPADTSLITMPGGPVVRAIADFGESVTDNVENIITNVYQENQAAVTPEIAGVGFRTVLDSFQDLSSQEINDASDRATRDVQAAIGALRDIVQNRTGGGAVATSPINANFVIKLGDSTLAEIKNQLINAPDVGGVDFVREVVG